MPKLHFLLYLYQGIYQINSHLSDEFQTLALIFIFFLLTENKKPSVLTDTEDCWKEPVNRNI